MEAQQNITNISEVFVFKYFNYTKLENCVCAAGDIFQLRTQNSPDRNVELEN